MRFMTIAACDPLVKHPALEEGAVFVNLLPDLAVRKVEVAVQCDPVVVSDRLSVDAVFVDLAAARVTSRAYHDFALRGSGRAATCIAGGGVDSPRDSVAILEDHREPLVCCKTFPVPALSRPGNVLGTGSMTRLAGHIDFREAR